MTDSRKNEIKLRLNDAELARLGTRPDSRAEELRAGSRTPPKLPACLLAGWPVKMLSAGSPKDQAHGGWGCSVLLVTPAVSATSMLWAPRSRLDTLRMLR